MGRGNHKQASSQCRVMSAVMREAQDTVEIPKNQETAKLSLVGGTEWQDKEGVSLSFLDKRQGLPSRDHIILDCASILRGWKGLFPTV